MERPTQELQAEITALRSDLGNLMTQVESDLKGAHAEICKFVIGAVMWLALFAWVGWLAFGHG